jgi:hypothetical protein
MSDGDEQGREAGAPARITMLLTCLNDACHSYTWGRMKFLTN